MAIRVFEDDLFFRENHQESGHRVPRIRHSSIFDINTTLEEGKTGKNG